ncbi:MULTISPECIES: transcriptional regulator FtrA [Paraburkholderia]|uniref:AraC family transcriptional regulator /AraC family transcriptional regulator with amidase-like domain n=1 Tax=Paraburkholderia tropica TaxID=92647 RepID=A0ABX5MG58_9BURK|nr:transcriptional regulator FtrA [Paraburkholderia tropica]MBB3001363.1 AraC family transcriptional activator FtrA [Paraburkholderia tropica]MBB6323361.1 AraC family transcriptional activator FtrA [Paraburkholderia tropica]PXX09553.1 AraC family transcriptional regulator /AraC family transcriptional regulator with amidase-like domain [Paraburkholderia tropica]PZW74613.1 AraC family transcriptional regulator /AraC family transcriptional regulator with amidase-like domain [Paraburkholderia tropi
MSRTAPHLVVALAYDRLCTFEFGCVTELFALERPELDVAWYRFAVCAAERGPLRAAGGVTVSAPYTLAMLDRAQTIVIPGWRDADERPPEALLRKLRAAHARGARLCSICSGVFVLAAAGVLDGKRVTTHWRYAEALQERYPQLQVEADALYIDEGQVLTSAGSAAGIDMLLHLVRRDHGGEVANRVAQRLVVPPHREGGQAQFVPRPMPRDESSPLARLMDWVRANPRLEHSVASLAARAAMSPRTLQRQFLDATGMGPYEWVVRERVSVARDLLEARPTLSMERVAELAGFGSEESLRRHFRRIALTTPAAYREQFARGARRTGLSRRQAR